MKRFNVALVIFMAFSTVAGAFCSEPSIYLSTPSKPSVPFCVNEWDNTHTCDEWQIQSYYSDLESYRSEAQDFIDSLNEYVDEAMEYAQCRAAEME